MDTLQQRLADNVFSCLADERMVFLDLSRDRYYCLNRCHTQTAVQLFAGRTGACRNRPVADIDAARAVIRVLSDHGLLAPDGATPGRADVSDILPPRQALPRQPSRPLGGACRARSTAFFRASAKLHWWPLQRVVYAVSRRKGQNTGLHARDADSLRELVGVFHRLRPYYPRRYQCLYDSLALLEYLARYCMFPQWVFGVVAEPFNAHCWVQQEECVLNDTLEYVRGFTPIAAF